MKRESKMEAFHRNCGGEILVEREEKKRPYIYCSKCGRNVRSWEMEDIKGQPIEEANRAAEFMGFSPWKSK